MIFTELEVPGVFRIDPEPLVDERGSFARTFCTDEFGAHGLDTRVAQCSASYNRHKGTLRGMHLQLPPHGETKLVRCTRGAIFDVAVDLRPDAVRLGAWTGATLSADNQVALYIPVGVAHGFLTLEDDTRVDYLMSTPYAPQAGAGVRWDDPAFAVDWPDRPAVISERDRAIRTVDLDEIRSRGFDALR